MAKPVKLDPEEIAQIYRLFGAHIDETNAQEIFNMLDENMANTSMRLHLTLSQAANSGLTQFIIVGRAMRTFQNFPWTKSEELAIFIERYTFLTIEYRQEWMQHYISILNFVLKLLEYFVHLS